MAKAAAPKTKRTRRDPRQLAEQEVGVRERVVKKLTDQHIAAQAVVNELEQRIDYESKRLTYAKANPALADEPLPDPS